MKDTDAESVCQYANAVFMLPEKRSGGGIGARALNQSLDSVDFVSRAGFWAPCCSGTGFRAGQSRTPAIGVPSHHRKHTKRGAPAPLFLCPLTSAPPTIKAMNPEAGSAVLVATGASEKKW